MKNYYIPLLCAVLHLFDSSANCRSTTIKFYTLFESFGSQTQELKNSTVINYNKSGLAIDSTLFSHSVPLSEKYVYVTGIAEGVKLQKTYDKKPVLSYRFTYDLNKNRSSTSLYGISDTLFWREFYKYDSMNRVIKTLRYSPGKAINVEKKLSKEEQEPTWKENFVYDSTGLKLKKEEIYDGYILEQTDFFKDKNGVFVKGNEYFDPSVIFKTTYLHNEYNQIINEVTVERYGNSLESRDYDYDDFGNKIKTNIYGSNGLLLERLETIHYELKQRITKVRLDSAENIISEIEIRLDDFYRPIVEAIIDENKRLVEKKVFKYDIYDRVSSIKTYDMLRRGKNDNEIPKTLITYEYH